jgi:hypothetical protein
VVLIGLLSVVPAPGSVSVPPLANQSVIPSTGAFGSEGSSFFSGMEGGADGLAAGAGGSAPGLPNQSRLSVPEGVTDRSQPVVLMGLLSTVPAPGNVSVPPLASQSVIPSTAFGSPGAAFDSGMVGAGLNQSGSDTFSVEAVVAGSGEADIQSGRD